MESLWQQAFSEDMPGGRRTCSEATSAGPQGLAMGWVQPQLREMLETSLSCPPHFLGGTDHSLNSEKVEDSRIPADSPSLMFFLCSPLLPIQIGTRSRHALERK